MNLQEYLYYLNDQTFGNPPPKPVRKPQPLRGPNQVQSKIPNQPKPPLDPQTRGSVKNYFNYMVWTTKILRQGEIFRKNCYQNNCEQFEVGTSDRRICKDRCDIETCKKIIALLKASISKCQQSQDPNRCKQRYATLIPLYQQKLNNISRKFVIASKQKQNRKISVG